LFLTGVLLKPLSSPCPSVGNDTEYENKKVYNLNDKAFHRVIAMLVRRSLTTSGEAVNIFVFDRFFLLPDHQLNGLCAHLAEICRSRTPAFDKLNRQYYKPVAESKMERGTQVSGENRQRTKSNLFSSIPSANLAGIVEENLP
jgi:hypothetical protein